MGEVRRAMVESSWKLGLVLVAVIVLFNPGCVTVRDGNAGGAKAEVYDSTIIKTELFFGLCRPDGSIVSESEWDRFVDEYITPRFREGLTIVDANGQWMMRTGEVVKEKTKIVILLHVDNEAVNASIEYVRDKYKKLFQQESVVRVSTYTGVVF